MVRDTRIRKVKFLQGKAKEEQRIQSKAVECSYSNKCKLCGEEVVWSIVEHLQDKHPDHPETKELNKKINELWDKFVESS